MTDRGGQQPPFVVEARGMRCPWPVLRAARAMREHQSILVQADDPRASEELRALTIERGWYFREDGPQLFRINAAKAD